MAEVQLNTRSESVKIAYEANPDTNAFTDAEKEKVAASLEDITGLISEGANINITGSGTSGSPYIISASGGGSVDSVTGTSNRISISGTSSDPVVDISSAYAGQETITTVGSVGTGTWQGTVVAGQYGGTGVANTGKTITVSGNTTIGLLS